MVCFCHLGGIVLLFFFRVLHTLWVIYLEFHRIMNLMLFRIFAACDEEWRRLAASAAETQRLLSPAMSGLGSPLRSNGTPLGAPLIISPRLPVPTTAASLLSGTGTTPILSPADHHGLIYTPYAEYANYAALASPLLTEYAADHTGTVYLSVS